MLGITPGKYETNRSDGNLKAGTGSLSNKIREAINKHGFIEQPDLIPETVSQTQKNQDSEDEDWFAEIYIKKNYEEAVKILNKKIRVTKKEDDKAHYEGYICFCQLQLNYKKGMQEYENLITKFYNNNISYKAYARSLMNNNNFNDAFKLIDKGLLNCERKVGLILMKAECLWLTNKKDDAISILENFKTRDSDICSRLATYYSENKDYESASKVAKEGYRNNPKDSELLSSFARIAFDMADYSLSLLLYNELVTITPKSQFAWCMLGNSYYHNDLYNSALKAYETANEFAKEKESWILENIGNLYNSIELYNKSEEFLTKGIKIFEKSEYGLSRLSDVYKSIEEEKKKIAEIKALGKAKLATETI